jgi:ribosomal protein S18 acetylase RimI-like enzyme
MRIRLAGFNDLDDLYLMYKIAGDSLRADGINMWDSKYPDKEFLGEDIRKGEMLVVDDEEVPGGIAAAFVLTEEIIPGYENGDWSCPDEPYVVLGRLCVNKVCQHRGLGTSIMDGIEESARKDGTSVIRLDTHKKNKAALDMYLDRGYEKVGSAVWRDEDYFLLEKKL